MSVCIIALYIWRCEQKTMLFSFFGILIFWLICTCIIAHFIILILSILTPEA